MDKMMMRLSHIRMGYAEGQKTPLNVFTDFDWIRRHEAELLETYGERFIIVYKEQVIGVGDTYHGALQDAEEKLPLDSGEITPVDFKLHHRQPFFRVRPKAN
ncbi:MAG: hypothetical protein ACYDBJ_15025 [Aggregatilineales bacterium]